jgi:anthranilate phosphoribosyltransferase
MGAATTQLAERLAYVLSRLSMRHAVVAAGHDGLDDISVSGPTTLFDVRGSSVTSQTITPFDLGLSVHPFESIEGGTPQENAALVRRVLTESSPLPLRDLVAAQAGAGLYVTGLAASIRQGVEMSIQAIDSGDAAAKLGAFVEATRRASAGGK